MQTRLKRLAVWVKQPKVQRMAWILLLSGLGGGLGIVWGSWSRACAGLTCPSIAEFGAITPEQSVKFYAADGRLITDAGIESRTVLPIEEMSTAVPAAVLAIEDKRFFRHNGIDFIGCGRAVTNVLLSFGNFSGGGCSSITMQLARNAFPDRLPSTRRSKLETIRRKVRELQVALELERTFSKERILELYLNLIFMGGRAYGMEEASQRYFGKSVGEVNVAEAATLAAMIQRPNPYDPRRYPDAIARRRNTVINLMRDQAYLTAANAERWKAYPIAVNTVRDENRSIGEYFVEWIRSRLYSRFGNDLYTKGYNVFTTLDLDMQLAAERTLEDRLRQIENGPDHDRLVAGFAAQSYQDYLDSLGGEPPETENTPYLQGAMLVADTLGRVRAMVGGRNFAESKFNRATQAERQAGSTFKPFVYSAAIRAGWSLGSIIEDAPINRMYEGDSMPWEPQNYEDDFRGPMTLRQGLRQSRNIVAIKLGEQLGVRTVVGEALHYGLSSTIRQVPSTFIGSASVKLSDMVAAYTAFASLGTQSDMVGILRVEDSEGNIVWEPGLARTRVMENDQMWLLTDMLQDVVNAGSGATAIRVNGQVPRSIPIGGKTGTTNDGADVWFIGFTPELVAGIWIGFDQPRKIAANAAGGFLAAPVFAEFAKYVYSRRPSPAPWRRPESLIARQIDIFTGYLASDNCPPEEKRLEWFYPGTQPTEICPIHSRGFQFTGTVFPPDADDQHHH